jgi:Uma2 family endonuclease
MGATTDISAEQYLRTSFPDLDREYRDGGIVERSVPDYFHSRTQLLIGVFFEALRRKLSVYACPELRLKLRDGLYLIPDVAVFWPSPPPTDRPPETPPLIVIEILSPDDRLGDVRRKLEEYRTWGEKYVWLVDPHSGRMYVCEEAGLHEVRTLTVSDWGLEIAGQDIFET